jgi:hypothetical protein
MSRPHRSINRPVNRVGLPPLLRHVIRAAASDTRRSDVNHAAALQALAQLFVTALPARGVLAPADDVCAMIDDIAARHLDRAGAERQFQRAMSRVPNVQERDAIETAHASIVDVSELAHYYAGLAAGIALAELGRPLR